MQSSIKQNKQYIANLISVKTSIRTLAILTLILFSLQANFAVADPKPGHPIATQISNADQEKIYAHLTGLDFSGKKTTIANKALKCGTPLAGVDFNHNHIDPLLRSSTQAIFERPTMQATYNSPDGRFKLHYNLTGDSAIKNSTIDLSGPLGAGAPDGVPDFINASADIFDSVWNIINGPKASGSKNLEYPIPPSDGAFITALNTDSLYDIYFVNFRGSFFGATVSENEVRGHYLAFPASISFTSYIQLDNDYAELSYRAVNNYGLAPLDAVRVTAAHEYFHSVQFGIDATEFEFEDGIARKYWYEMSAVSMEEYQYDHIDDYYGYLFNSSTDIPFNAPHTSLETFSISSDYPYAMGVFPIWLTNKFGPEIVRGIWRGCGQPGPNFLAAADSALISFTSGEYDFHRAFREFGVALALSGERSKFAPAGYGFQESEFYPTIARDTIFTQKLDESIDTTVITPIHSDYPIQNEPFGSLSPVPQSNSHSFIFYKDVLSITNDCFKPQIVIPSATIINGITPSITLVAIPKSQLDSAIILTSAYDRITVDTILLIEEEALDATLQSLLDSFACHDTITVDTLYPGTINDLSPDSIHFRVADIVPSVTLPDPTRYSDVIQIVTQTSLDPRDYENFLGPLEYPYAYRVISSSTTIASDAQPFSLRTPYPNPILSENSRVVFEALRDPLMRNTDEITLRITIFTENGEIVRDNLTETSGPSFTQVAVIWDLKNQSGATVAPGVYLALEKLMNGADEILISEVTKVLVIR